MERALALTSTQNCGPRPRWEPADAQFVDDVRPFEVAKLHMLNGAHSALAYLAEPLAALWRSAGENGIVEALFGCSGFFAEDWIATDAERDLLNRLVWQGELRRSADH